MRVHVQTGSNRVGARCIVAGIMLALSAGPAYAAGTVKATVLKAGTRPQPAPLNMSDDRYCAKVHEQGEDKGTDAHADEGEAGGPVTAENFVISAEGKVKNVIVYVKAGLEDKEYPPPTEKALLDQRGCMYHPHVMTVMVGQPVTVRNSDDTLHNIHSFARKQRAFNFPQAKQGMERDVIFKKPEFVKIKCDVHPWMLAYIGVFDHPFHAVTDTHGVGAIGDLPPGAYTLAVWHEEFGELEQRVTVKEGEESAITFTFDNQAEKK